MEKEPSHSIVIPMDKLLSTKECQHLSLFFEEIVVLPVYAHGRISIAELDQLEATIEYLRDEGVLKTVGFCPYGSVIMQPEDNQYYHFTKYFDGGADYSLKFSNSSVQDKEAVLDFLDMAEDDIDASLFEVSAMLNNQGNNSVFQMQKGGLLSCGEGNAINAIEVTLNNIACPPSNIPWEDLVHFRNEKESQALHRNLRRWIRNVSTTGCFQNKLHFEDELLSMLDDFESYMKIQHQKYDHGSIASLANISMNVFENLGNLKLGSALRGLFDVRGRRLQLEESKIIAPGREVAYVSRVNKRFCSR